MLCMKSNKLLCADGQHCPGVMGGMAGLGQHRPGVMGTIAGLGQCCLGAIVMLCGMHCHVVDHMQCCA
eukprot:9641931-Lingulodinium_polyedra.AAC.1